MEDDITNNEVNCGHDFYDFEQLSTRWGICSDSVVGPLSYVVQTTGHLISVPYRTQWLKVTNNVGHKIMIL
jgi:hypothetical protein